MKNTIVLIPLAAIAISLVFSGCSDGVEPLQIERGQVETPESSETTKTEPDEAPSSPAAPEPATSEETGKPEEPTEPMSEPEAVPPDAQAPAVTAESLIEKAARDTSAVESKIKELSGNTTDLIAAVSGKTPKGPPFVFAEAVDIPDLAPGGFSTEPAFVENFDSGWESGTKDWQIATWTQNKTEMSRARARANEDGHLVLTVKAGEPARGGSIQSTREFGYGRWIARVRPSPVPGVLNSVFTKDWDDLTTETKHDGRKAEVDFEFLTHTFGPDSGEIHLAVHLLNKHPLFHVDIPLDFNPSDEFRDWGFDILPDKVIWHVDGKLLFAWEYTDEYFIDENYEFFFNAWTNVKWIQGPPEEDADYHIDWLKFYPYQK